MGSEERDNPLFGHTNSPSPSKPGTLKNPVWSPSDKPAWQDPSTVPRLSPRQNNNNLHQQQPASTVVKGMRRLSSLDPWEIDAARRRQQLSEEHITTEADDDIDMQDNNEGGGYQRYQQLFHNNNRGFPPPMSLITNNNTSSSSSTATALGHPPEELEFAQVLELVMRGELDTSAALQQYAKICMDRAGELREQARAEVQRAARQAALVNAAQELEAESATWQLLWHLYGVESREFPGGKGGNFADGAGLEKTFRQRAADVVFQDDEVNRCARIVAWLEALSSEALVIQSSSNSRGGGGGGGGGRHHHQQSEAGASSFTSTDGLWRETKSKIAGGLMGRDAATLVNRVDPDAMTRQIGKRLLPENTRDEERLAVEIWRLVRAGKMSAAAKLCEAVGQPWRAASLTGGGGPQGVLPVGTAALEADESEDMADVQAADLAVDVESGEWVSRALWRWTCALAADRIVATASSFSGDGNGPTTTTSTTTNNKGALYESALYGVLSSHLARVLPVCKSWEDMLWATLRCWLDAAVDIQLGVGLGDSGDAFSLAELPLFASNQQQEIYEGGHGGDWPPEQLRDALPSSFLEAVSNLADGSGSGRGTSALLSSSTAAAGAAPASYLSGNQGNAAQYRSVQNALMLESIQELVCEILYIWVIKKSGAGMDTNTSLSEQQQQLALGGRNQSFPSLQGGGGGGGGGTEMTNMDNTTTNVNDDEDSPSSPPSIMRFAAHMALGLWGLGIMSPSSGHQIDIDDDNNRHHQGGEYSPVVQDTLHRLVQVYVARLIDSGAHNLVPLYACHLRAGLRWMTYHAFFDQLIAAGAAEGAGGNMAACKAAYDFGDSWFRYWKQSGGNNSNTINNSFNEGDMAEDEMAVIALGSVKRSRFEVYGGPMLRAQFIRWLCFGDVEEKAAAAHGANVLCREFALAGSGGLAAADALLVEIMPAALGQPLDEFLNELPELRQKQRKEGVVMEEEEEEERPSTSAFFLEKQGLVGQIEELKCWIAYFHIQSEFASWCQLYAEAREAAAEEGGTIVTDQLKALGEETLPLLEEATAFVSDRKLQWLVEDTLPTDFTKGSHVPPTSSSPFEIAVVVGPEMGLEAPLSHQFPTFTDDQEVAAVSEGVMAAMRDAAASVSTASGGGGSAPHSSSLISGLEVAAGPAPEDMPSMLSIAIDYSAAKKQQQNQQQQQDGMAVAVALLGLVLKGATRLVGDDGMPLLGPLSIVNMDAHPLAAAELCRTVCYPRMALMAAAMREAVAYMGVSVDSGAGAGEAGSGLAEAAAAADLTKYFSTMELKELLQYERATEVLQMRNVEKKRFALNL